MKSSKSITSPSKTMLWVGAAFSALAVLFLIFDATIKVAKLAPAVEATAQLGYPEAMVGVIGAVELICTLVYAIPRTSVLGAILLTGFLGGAVASHARIDSPLFSHVLFPVYVAILAWGGLFLRDRRLRGLVPLRSRATAFPTNDVVSSQ